MKAAAPRSARQTSERELRLDRLMARQVLAANNRPVGRLEEFRATKRGRDYQITEYVIGAAGLLERLGVGMLLLIGRRSGGYVVRWDQLDISDPERPRLKCGVEELTRL